MQPMNVLVIDGQGGGLGKQLVAALSTQCPEARLTAVGTNSLAANAMRKAGAPRAATGENANKPFFRSLPRRRGLSPSAPQRPPDH